MSLSRERLPYATTRELYTSVRNEGSRGAYLELVGRARGAISGSLPRKAVNILDESHNQPGGWQFAPESFGQPSDESNHDDNKSLKQRLAGWITVGLHPVLALRILNEQIAYGLGVYTGAGEEGEQIECLTAVASLYPCCGTFAERIRAILKSQRQGGSSLAGPKSIQLEDWQPDDQERLLNGQRPASGHHPEHTNV